MNHRKLDLYLTQRDQIPRNIIMSNKIGAIPNSDNKNPTTISHNGNRNMLDLGEVAVKISQFTVSVCKYSPSPCFYFCFILDFSKINYEDLNT